MRRFLLALITFSAAPLAAQSNKSEDAKAERKYILYGGIGEVEANGKRAWSIGITETPAKHVFTYGTDFSVEGAETTATAANYLTKAGYSSNSLIGGRTAPNNGWRVGASALIGIRFVTTTCTARVTRGTACYAQNEENSYELNVGAVGHVTYGALMFGARVTQASTQVLFGLSF